MKDLLKMSCQCLTCELSMHIHFVHKIDDGFVLFLCVTPTTFLHSLALSIKGRYTFIVNPMYSMLSTNSIYLLQIFHRSHVFDDKFWLLELNASEGCIRRTLV